MAITTRFFSTAGAGAADGTTWADRAALFTAGNWSSVITGHDFTTNSLKCLIGPGAYTCGQNLTTTVITADPTPAHPLFLIGCDSSGVMLTLPDPDWMSCQPAWTATGLPSIDTTTNVGTIGCANVWCYLVKFTASGRTGGAIMADAAGFSWCQILNSTANASTMCVQTVITPMRLHGCVLKCTGASYAAIIDANSNNIEAINCRIEGVAGSSGNRHGINSATTADDYAYCTIVNCGGKGFNQASTSTSQSWRFYRCTVANNAGDGLHANSTASQTEFYRAEHCLITGNGGFGINPNSDAARWFIEGNRLRDNSSGNIGSAGDFPVDMNNYTTDSDDASEYVSTGADGDFRIINTATIWGQGYGAGDQAASASTGPVGHSIGQG